MQEYKWNSFVKITVCEKAGEVTSMNTMPWSLWSLYLEKSIYVRLLMMTSKSSAIPAENSKENAIEPHWNFTVPVGTRIITGDHMPFVCKFQQGSTDF